MLRIVLLTLALAVAACTTTTTVNGVVVPDGDLAGGKSEAEPRRRAEIRVQLAASYLQGGQPTIALEEARKAVAADPDYGPARALLGLVLQTLGDAREAATNYEAALRLAPGDPEIENSYGWYLCQTGRERDAIGYFDRAAANRLYRTPAMALLNAGICLAKAGDAQAAERYLQRALQLDAGNTVTKYHLARLALAAGQVDRAGFYYGLLGAGQANSAAALWLGVRIARANLDLRLQRERSDELQRRFPGSPEAALLARGQFDE